MIVEVPAFSPTIPPPIVFNIDISPVTYAFETDEFRLYPTNPAT